ncbi:MAG: TetR/AcrR family transcriptional regulator [Actinomycetota bacterium]
MAAKKSSTKAKRRSPISRAEGERRLKDAARKLISERPFTDVGVREIAAEADVNHGFVHTWFGSKNDLLLEVLRDLMVEAAEQTASSPAGAPAIQPFDPVAQQALRLVMFLKLEGASFGDLFDDPIVIKAFVDRYVNVEGIEPRTARIAAQQVVAIGAAVVLFGDVIGVKSNDDVAALLGQWRHILGLLAEHHPA